MRLTELSLSSTPHVARPGGKGCDSYTRKMFLAWTGFAMAGGVQRAPQVCTWGHDQMMTKLGTTGSVMALWATMTAWAIP
jgi:hypothetical protein